jgi:transglutaminase-like putative cysteine protease
VSPGRGHDLAALAAAGAGVAATLLVGVIGPGTAALALVALLLGYGRGRGWTVSRVLERPRWWTGLGAVYLPMFLFDLILVSRGDPVPALVRLVLFLLAAEVLAGDPARAHRPVLFGLLLVVASAAETTEIGFALPLGIFVLAAGLARFRATLRGARSREALPPVRGAVPVAAGTLALGVLLFFLVPHLGTGWGRHPIPGANAASLETGLTDAVHLGVVGRVKQRHTVAFRAKLDRPDLDPGGIYWRAITYARWTGEGWTRNTGEETLPLKLHAGERVAVPFAPREEKAGLVAEVVLARPNRNNLPVPGFPLWVRTPRRAMLVSGPDGVLRSRWGPAPHRYEVAVAYPGDAEDPLPSGAGRSGDAVHALYLETGRLDPRVTAWAEEVGRTARDRIDLARAFVADLRRRPYSLDTGAVDPVHPVASFLAGAPAHCEYFASAMVLGLRSRGVPARVVGGYLGAERVPFTGDLIVRDARAHLWVEMSVPGTGWLSFDPTPAEGRQVTAGSWLAFRAVWDRTVTAWDSWIIGLDLGDQMNLLAGIRGGLHRLLRALANVGLPWLGAGMLLLGGLFGWMLLKRRTRRSRTAQAGLPAFYRRMLDLAARRGVRPTPPETAGEFARRVGPVLGDPRAVLQLSEIYERERFGGRPATRDELAEARTTLARLKRLANGGRCLSGPGSPGSPLRAPR